MSVENPYQAPQTPTEAGHTQPMYVEGPHLVVKSGVRLPLRCIITNKPLTESDVVPHALCWKGRSFQLVMKANSGKVYWAISPDIRRRMRLVSLGTLCCGVVIVAAICLLLAFASRGMWVASVLLICSSLAAGLLSQRWSESLPQLQHFENGYFWLSGFGTEFLQSVDADTSR